MKKYRKQNFRNLYYYKKEKKADMWDVLNMLKYLSFGKTVYFINLSTSQDV